MFKHLIQMIIASANREEAMQNVFYGPIGIEAAYQHEKITWKEHEMLYQLIQKMK